MTEDPPRSPLRGVSVIALADDRYEIELCLVVEIMPLLALGEEVRVQVALAVAREQLSFLLGAVSVNFAGVVSSREISERAARQSESAAIAKDTDAWDSAASASPAAARVGTPAASLHDQHLP